MQPQCRKVYVSVNIDVDKDGGIRPRMIRWEDGHIYKIDRLKYKCQASSLKVGGYGIRYTVSICGKETFLYDEDGKWFVEARR